MTSFKSRLRQGETVTLVNPDHASAGLVNAISGMGIDAVMLDCEQGTPSFENIEDMTRAAKLHGVASLVRIPSPEPWTIERYIMRGIDGVIIPRLDTAAQVKQAIHDIRYAAAKKFEEKTIIIQVESVSALSELDDFLAVPEVDCYFIGAVDLAKSMGYEGDYGHQVVMNTLKKTVRHIRDAGRAVGFLVKDSDVKYWQSVGATMLYTHVNDFIKMGIRDWNELVHSHKEQAPIVISP